MLSKLVANPNPVASLSLQVTIKIDYYVQWVFVYITGILMLYKIYEYSFPLSSFFVDMLIFVGLIALQFTRLFIGARGNKTESFWITSLFILLSLVTIVGNLYFLDMQTYVIVIEAIIGFVSIGMGGLQFILGINAAIGFFSM